MTAPDTGWVTDADWFDQNPGARFRARQGGDGVLRIVKRHGKRTFFRIVVPDATKVPATEDEAAAMWERAAYPHDFLAGRKW
jgi:hypothetical protein